MLKSKKIIYVITLVLIFSLTFAVSAEELPEVEWTMQTSWSDGSIVHEYVKDFSKKVAAMTGGKFKINVLPAGAICGSMEVLDATASGIIDGYQTWGGYWLTKHPAAVFFGSVPMSSEASSHLIWYYGNGGHELHKEMFEEIGYPIMPTALGMAEAEVLAHSNVPLKNLEDFKGLKYRAPGIWNKILQGMGVAVTTLPSSELYPALEKGVLDATEFSFPIMNDQSGFDEVTEYVAGPGMHQPSCFFEGGFNKTSFESLPEEYQEILMEAAIATTLEGWAKTTVADIKTLKEWTENEKFTHVSEEAQAEFREQAWNWMDKDVEKKDNELYTKTWKSFKEFYVDYSDYQEFMVPVRPSDYSSDSQFSQ